MTDKFFNAMMELIDAKVQYTVAEELGRDSANEHYRYLELKAEFMEKYFTEGGV